MGAITVLLLVLELNFALGFHLYVKRHHYYGHHHHGCECYDPCKKEDHDEKPQGYLYAECHIKPNPSIPDLDDQIYGVFYFKQKASGGPVDIKAELSGFDTTDEDIYHGFHIHTYGTIQDGCEGSGDHYDPHGTPHGGPDDPAHLRHVGDLGNLKEEDDDSGMAFVDMTDDVISMTGVHNIMGRALNVDAHKNDFGQGDDPGSDMHGNSGPAIGCCVIVVSDGSGWE